MAHIEALVILHLLLVDDAESKVDLICLVKARSHAHDLGKGFFGMVQRSVAIVEDANAVPQLRLLHDVVVSGMPLAPARHGYDACLGVGQIV